MSRLRWEHFVAAIIVLCTLIGMLFLSVHIFPISGNWVLVDILKMHSGAVLYKDIYTVFPPVLYIFTDLVYRAFGEPLWLYRILGCVLVSATFLAQYILVRKMLSTGMTALTIGIAVVMYLRTPWEIFYTYLYISYALVISAMLLVNSKRVPLPYLFAGVLMGIAWMTKITSGGLSSLALLFYLLFLCGLRIYDREWVEAKRWAIRFLQAAAGIVVGYVLPFVWLNLSGLHASLGASFGQLYESGAKGTLATILVRPFIFLFDTWLTTVTQQFPDVSSLTGFLNALWMLYDVRLLSGALFVTAAGFGIVALARALDGKERRGTLGNPPFIVAFVIGATFYASAMSGFFDADNGIVATCFLTFTAGALSETLKVSREDARGRMVLRALLGCVALIVVCSGIARGISGYIDIFTIAAGFFLLRVFINRFGNREAVLSICGIALIFVGISYKYNVESYNWWQSITEANDSPYYTRLGFFASPMYDEYTTYMFDVNDCLDRYPAQRTAYSFPTSTLPYHILRTLPPTRSAVAHADVFAAKYVDEEFDRIERAKPEFLFLSAWTDAKMAEIDQDFHGSAKSSQTQLWHKLVPFARRDYRLVELFDWAGAPEPINFPIQVWLRKGAPRGLVHCVAGITLPPHAGLLVASGLVTGANAATPPASMDHLDTGANGVIGSGHVTFGSRASGGRTFLESTTNEVAGVSGGAAAVVPEYGEPLLSLARSGDLGIKGSLRVGGVSEAESSTAGVALSKANGGTAGPMPPCYTASGEPCGDTTHMVTGEVAVRINRGDGSGVANVLLGGAATFRSSVYRVVCTVDLADSSVPGWDSPECSGIRVASGSQFKVEVSDSRARMALGSGTIELSWIAIGN